MLTAVSRFFVRRRLKAEVLTMTGILSRLFGSNDSYSAGQVSRAHKDANAQSNILPYAFAAFCTAEDFAKSPARLDHDYHALRNELVVALKLSGPDFSIRELRGLRSKSKAEVGYDDTNGNSGYS